MDNPNMARARAKEAALSPDRLRELMDYDQETGIVTSRVTRPQGGKWVAGRRLGGLMVNGYRKIGIDWSVYLEHRVIWAWMTGQWPDDEIDHVNLDRADNRWINLRAATRGENCLNHPGRPKMRAGKLKGITPCGGKWRAHIMFNRKCYYLGLFPTQDEAHAAYVAASKEFHGDYGRDRS